MFWRLFFLMMLVIPAQAEVPPLSQKPLTPAATVIVDAPEVPLPPRGRVNARISPLFLVVGIPDVALDVRGGDRWTVGADYTRFTFGFAGVSFGGTSYGMRGVFAPKGAFESGWYLSARAGRLDFKADTKDAGLPLSASTSAHMLGAAGGYHWFGRHANVNLGAVLNYISIRRVDLQRADNTVGNDVSIPGVLPGLDLLVGWTF